MLEHVKQCEASGTYDDEFEEINTIFSANFNNRHKGCAYDRPDMTGGGSSMIEIAGVNVYEYM